MADGNYSTVFLKLKLRILFLLLTLCDDRAALSTCSEGPGYEENLASLWYPTSWSGEILISLLSSSFLSLPILAFLNALEPIVILFLVYCKLIFFDWSSIFVFLFACALDKFDYDERASESTFIAFDEFSWFNCFFMSAYSCPSTSSMVELDPFLCWSRTSCLASNFSSSSEE